MVQVRGKSPKTSQTGRWLRDSFFYVLYKENQGNIRVFKKSEKRDCALFIWLNDLNRELVV